MRGPGTATALGLALGWTADPLLGDPRRWHPVAGFGRLATAVEQRTYADDRLRGSWTACDGAGGRMTADTGLHNLPAALRPGVAAHVGQVLVRADLGQIEPRVLAVVSGDRTFAEATRADDLYAPVAARLGVE